METASVELELKELLPEGRFTGILASYNRVDLSGDLIEPGAFTKTISERKGEVPLLWQHKSDMPIGTLKLIDGPDALHVQGELLMALPEAQKAYLLIKAGIVKGLSIGYEAIKTGIAGAIRQIKEIKLFEGSLVTHPMDESALVLSVKTWLLPLTDVSEVKAGRQISTANMGTLATIHDHLKAAHDSNVRAKDLMSALLAEAGSTTSGDEAVDEPKSKPDASTHHLAASLEQLRSLLRAA